MGMSTYAEGFRPATTEKWQKMAAVWHACTKAGIPVPPEVDRFFEGDGPDPAGARVDIDEACRPWKDEYAEGIEVDVTKLPDDVTIIRFSNSW